MCPCYDICQEPYFDYHSMHVSKKFYDKFHINIFLVSESFYLILISQLFGESNNALYYEKSVPNNY